MTWAKVKSKALNWLSHTGAPLLCHLHWVLRGEPWQEGIECSPLSLVTWELEGATSSDLSTSNPLPMPGLPDSVYFFYSVHELGLDLHSVPKTAANGQCPELCQNKSVSLSKAFSKAQVLLRLHLCWDKVPESGQPGATALAWVGENGLQSYFCHLRKPHTALGMVPELLQEKCAAGRIEPPHKFCNGPCAYCAVNTEWLFLKSTIQKWRN